MPEAQSPETQSRLEYFRQKSLDNSITREELIEAIRLMRQDRLAAAARPQGKAKAKAPARSADQLLGDLGL